MALPDLDTNDVGWIAYWNFLDNGASDITPDDATSAMSSSTTYDNGVEGNVSVSFDNYKSNRDIPCRVKDDGWIIAWLPRTPADEGTRTTADLEGPYDVMNDWTSTSGLSYSQHRLERVVNTLYTSLSNSGDATYNSGEVGLYNFEHASADTYTTFYPIQTNSWTFTVRSGTNNLYAGWLAASSQDAGVKPTVVWATSQENVTMAFDDIGARDIVGRNEVTPGEQINVDGNRADGAMTSIYLLWD